MARIIQCDRCSKKIDDEDGIYRLTFSPMPKATANTQTAMELCERCFDYVYREANEAPPQAGRP